MKTETFEEHLISALRIKATRCKYDTLCADCEKAAYRLAKNTYESPAELAQKRNEEIKKLEQMDADTEAFVNHEAKIKRDYIKKLQKEYPDYWEYMI